MQEMSHFAAAVQQACDELQTLRDQLATRIGKNEAAIFEAHQMIVSDPMLAEQVQAAVEQGQIVEQAVVNAIDEVANAFAAMSDELFAARAADVRDVGRRLLRILLGLPDTSLANVRAPSVIVANDLSPSDTANLDPHMTLGFCTAMGGMTSHSAILARTMGIPAIVAMGQSALSEITTGARLLLDGEQGVLIMEPDGVMVEAYQRLGHEREMRLSDIKVYAKESAQTADGKLIEVAANIGDLASAQDAVENGAEGVGLFRTEFLYLGDAHPPSEERQVQAYQQVFQAIGQRPIIVRTLDIGGDKPPSYLPFPQEMNPFLGWRGVRVSLDRQDLFRAQLRAILRAAVGYPVRIMFPMVSTLEELQRARGLVAQVDAELTSERKTHAEQVPIGIMVETPAAAVLVDVLAEAADFFSLGTNDLTQYTLAVDRGNGAVAGLYQSLHPSVLRLIKQTIDLAHAKGKWVGMCGELAAMQKAIPILLGLGLDEFSMNPRAIPEAKYLIRRIDARTSREVAMRALEMGTAAEIEAYMEDILKKL